MHTNSMRLEIIKKESISRQSQSHETALQLYGILFKNFLLFFKVLKRIFFILLRQSMHDYTFLTSINGNVKRKKLLWIEYVPLCGQGKIFFGTSLGQMGKQLQAGAIKAELGQLGFVHSRLQVGYKSDR